LQAELLKRIATAYHSRRSVSSRCAANSPADRAYRALCKPAFVPLQATGRAKILAITRCEVNSCERRSRSSRL